MATRGADGGSLLLPAEQMRYFTDEACKLAGLPRPPAMIGSAAQKLVNGGVKSSLPGVTSVTAKLSKATSPTAIVPPPPISA